MASQDQTLKPVQYGYTIRDDIGGEITIRASANAWWNDVARVGQLIAAFKKGYSQRNAALRIGISKDQLHYFLRQHPEFYDKMEDFREVFKMKLIDAIYEAIDRGDASTIRWVAERTIPEYRPKKKVPLAIIPISMREDGKQFASLIEASGEQTAL